MLWPYVRPELPRLGAALILGLMIAALGAAQPLLTRVVIDDGLIGRHFDRLIYACLAMVALASMGMALGALHRAIYVRASGRTLFALRRAAFAHLLRVSPRHLAELPVGDLVARLDGDVAEVQRFGTDSVATFVSSILSLCLVSVVMVGISWRLSLMIVALAPLQLVVRHIARPRIESSTRAVRNEAGRVSSFLIEILTGARAVQAAAAETHELCKLDALGEGYLGRVVNSQLVAYATGTAVALIGHLATAATFVVGGWYVIHGELTVGALVAFTAYLGRTAGSAASLAGLYTGYQRALVSLQRLQKLFELPVVKESASAIGLPRDARGALEFRAVTVRLAREGRCLLDNATLSIPAGKKIVLRGASGVGKTTISDLLRRFVEPDSGRILLDGVPLDQIRLADLRSRIVVVDHSPMLFRGTILDNLRYGQPQVNEAAVLRAAVLAQVDEFVQDLADGYLTLVGEGGAGLSTGQRQRIAIARASLTDPLVVILDEATSGLDRESSRSVHRAIDHAFGHRTRIIITHHAIDLETADRCLLLEAGRLQDIVPG